jgi:hypothetical protein
MDGGRSAFKLANVGILETGRNLVRQTGRPLDGMRTISEKKMERLPDRTRNRPSGRLSHQPSFFVS